MTLLLVSVFRKFNQVSYIYNDFPKLGTTILKYIHINLLMSLLLTVLGSVCLFKRSVIMDLEQKRGVTLLPDIYIVSYILA